MPLKDKDAYNLYQKEYMRKKNGWKLISQKTIDIEGKEYTLTVYKLPNGKKESKIEESNPSFAELLGKIWKGEA